MIQHVFAADRQLATVAREHLQQLHESYGASPHHHKHRTSSFSARGGGGGGGGGGSGGGEVHWSRIMLELRNRVDFELRDLQSRLNLLFDFVTHNAEDSALHLAVQAKEEVRRDTDNQTSRETDQQRKN